VTEQWRWVMPSYEIEKIKNNFVNQLSPVKIYLFGSYVNDTYTDESDLDSYIIVSDGVSDIAAETTKAYKAIRKVKRCPVDIIVGTQSRFDERKEITSVENEVYRNGILLYDATSLQMY
jgi:predicted nucleotidyltransferase